MITELDHIAIAVPDIDEAIERFLNDFGLTYEGKESVESEQTMTAFFPIRGTSIELIQPVGNQGPLTKHLEKRGPGLHHICFKTDDIDADVAHLKAKGYQFLSDRPTPGAHDAMVIFIHPKSCGGVLIELNEYPETSHD